MHANPTQFCSNSILSTFLLLFVHFLYRIPLPTSNELSNIQLLNLCLHGVRGEHLTWKSNSQQDRTVERLDVLGLAVSISSAHQPFARICEGKKRLTNQKKSTYQTFNRLDNSPQSQPPNNRKNRMQELQELSKKVSKSV
jgi:hypothetical protein